MYLLLALSWDLGGKGKIFRDLVSSLIGLW